MCQNLVELCQLASDGGMPTSIRDVIQLTCGICPQIEICPSVTLDEYDWRTAEISNCPVGPAANFSVEGTA